jgi:hypothetical protein
MIWLVKLLAPVFGKIAAAPILDIIERLVADADLKQRLKTEIAGKLIDRDRSLILSRRSVVLAEQSSESWLVRSWRPTLMFLLMGFLFFFGLVVPLAELIVGRSIPVDPHLDRIPEPAWTLLTLGLSGYVGGRTVEKIALGWLAQSRRPANSSAAQGRTVPKGRKN